MTNDQKFLGTFPTVELAHQRVAAVKRAYEDLGYDNFKETEFVIRFYGAEPEATGKAA